MSVFSERLVALMKKNKLSQKKLAQKVGVTQPAMSRYVRGDRIPRSDTLERISKALGTTTDDLLGVPESVYLERIKRIQWNLYKLSPDQLEKAEKILKITFDDVFEDKE